jgi:hypothetical protein
VTLHQRDDVLLLRHVGRYGQHVHARLRELLLGVLEVLRAAGRDRDPESLLAEHLRDREPDAARTAGHEG